MLIAKRSRRSVAPIYYMVVSIWPVFVEWGGLYVISILLFIPIVRAKEYGFLFTLDAPRIPVDATLS